MTLPRQRSLQLVYRDFVPCLPPLDPDYLIEEHNPTRLHEFAVGLLQHLHAIRQGKPKNGYDRTTIKAAADWLLGQYAEAKASAPIEAVMLWHEVLHVRPKRRARTGGPRVQKRVLDAYYEAIRFDAAHDEVPTLYAVAKHVCSKRAWNLEAAKASIRKWRKEPDYNRQVFEMRRNWSARRSVDA